MPTNIDICSNALLLIGDDPISSFEDPGAGATAAANLYQTVYEDLLSSHPWSFALKEQTLSKLSQTPDNKTHYQYAYQTPVDLIRYWAVLPHSNYVLIGPYLYSNVGDGLLARYIADVEETSLPAHFIQALQYRLAADFAISVTEDTGKAQLYEGKYLQALGKAMSIDSQGRPQEAIIDSPFIDVRY